MLSRFLRSYQTFNPILSYMDRLPKFSRSCWTFDLILCDMARLSIISILHWIVESMMLAYYYIILKLILACTFPGNSRDESLFE